MEEVAVLRAVIVDPRRSKGIADKADLLFVISLDKKGSMVDRLPRKVVEGEVELLPLELGAIRHRFQILNRVRSHSR